MKSAVAVSRPVNPPGTKLILNESQVWKGLGIKARDPAPFVPQIEKCDVLVDEPTHVERRVTFRDGPTFNETVDEYESTAAYFELESGTRVLNILSYDSDMSLILTFSFVNGVPGVPHGAPTPQGAELKALCDRIGQGAVQSTIDRIRELVENGTIV